MSDKYHFASDNTSPTCPEAWATLSEVNQHYLPSYGADTYTAKACEAFRNFFECDCEVYFVFNGTAANSLALASLCQSYHSVITHESSHVETDECGAPEFFSNGTKLLLGKGNHGKLTPESVEALITKRSDIHYPRARVLSLSQPTELGTRYSIDEIRSLTELTARHDLKVHMDGARFFHALVAEGCTPKALTHEAGIDVLCFGGTKAGLGFSEAVVFFDKGLAREFEYRCKQAGQLASKMRYLSAPWAPWLNDRLYEKYSRVALESANNLGEQLSQLEGVKLMYPIEANSVFLEMPERVHTFLNEKGWRYYQFIGGAARFMCSWHTTPGDVASLAKDIRAGSLQSK